MRLKPMEGPLSIHNVNSNVLNSPKRLNTIQNSNITTGDYQTTNNSINLTANIPSTNLALTNANLKISDAPLIRDLNATELEEYTNNLRKKSTERVPWFDSILDVGNENENVNRQQRNNQLNINNKLASSLRTPRATAQSICSESSPDDSILDYEEVRQSCSSSTDTSPHDEDPGFYVSDSESLSEEGNLRLDPSTKFSRRGIVNPNYPGFQHFAHTLDYGVKFSSDTEFTDDDLETDTTDVLVDNNTVNNNNNVANNILTDAVSTEEIVDKIDSVNRLDSVENIQKVFYDKHLDCESFENFENSSNQQSDEDIEKGESVSKPELTLNISTEENCRGEISLEVGEGNKETLRTEKNCEQGSRKLYEPDKPCYLDLEPTWERAVVQEIEEAIEKLTELLDLEPSAKKYNIEPNTEEPFSKLSDTEKAIVLEDSVIVANKMADLIKENCPPLSTEQIKESIAGKTKDAFLTSIHENLPEVNETLFEVVEGIKKYNALSRDSNRELEEIECQIKKIKSEVKASEGGGDEIEKFSKEDATKEDKEKEDEVPRKKEKMSLHLSGVRKRKDYNQQFASLITFPKRDSTGRGAGNKKPVSDNRERKKRQSDNLECFDVYNIETAMPKIDLEAIELHLRASRDEERRRRTDREEIRRRLAMGCEDDYYNDRPGRKPSLQARLQSGMNLQICFMNEAVSDTDSPSSDSECPLTNPKQPKSSPKNTNRLIETPVAPPIRPVTLSIGEPLTHPANELTAETDFFTKQARLQTEARMALAQAKEMARMQMEIEKQKLKKSPITEMVRHSLEKVGIPFPEDKRRLSRQILTEMNVAQLQVIVNDLHTQIEILNENLVKYLMDRDDLHMGQDSMLVDIEDLSRYLGAKEHVVRDNTLNTPLLSNNNTPPSPAPSSPLTTAINNTVRPHLHRIASLVKK